MYSVIFEKISFFFFSKGTFIKTIGGSCVRNHVLLTKLFTDEFGIKCSITGRGKEVTTKVGESMIVQIVKSNNMKLNTFQMSCSLRNIKSCICLFLNFEFYFIFF